MKYIIPCLAFFHIFFTMCHSVTSTPKRQITYECYAEFDSLLNKQVYTSVDRLPSYPGGQPAMLTFIHHNYKYDVSFPRRKRVIVKLIVDTDGSLLKCAILNSKKPYSPIENEALRIINLMPKWVPGECNNKVVPAWTFVPIDVIVRRQ